MPSRSPEPARAPRALFRSLACLLLAIVSATADGGSGILAGPVETGSAFDATDGAGAARGLASTAAEAEAATERPIHLVLLQSPPLASYRGGIAGLAPTSPEATGDRKLVDDSPAARAYLDHLEVERQRGLREIRYALGGSDVAVVDTFTHALNGFTLRVSDREADRIADLPLVRHVEREQIFRLATDVGPAWSGASGIWDGSTPNLPGNTLGEGIVVGILDTGTNTDHPSFAEVDEAGYEHANPRETYLGWCNPDHPNHDPNASWRCNDKLIGLWSHPNASNDPEDENGHGSHTASTAAGNRIGAAEVGSTLVISRSISGVAPHANIVGYDVCRGGGCNSAATMAGTEQAVRDGVDVINYSITVGNNLPWNNGQNMAFLAARDAGIFVAVAAGNNGPQASTLTSNAPWVLTSANSSHNRTILNRLEEMSGGSSAPPEPMVNKGFTAGYGPARIVYAEGFLHQDGSRDDGRCLEPFRADQFRQAIVVCDRGENARVAKGANVKEGGAGGFVLANTAAEGASTNGDAHALPAIHVSDAQGQALKDWLARGSGHTAAIAGASVDEDAANGDRVNASSSRGPNRVTLCCVRPEAPTQRYETLIDVLKPDVSAPGTDILAAIASGEQVEPPEFGMMSGTSMASPHSAGGAALIRALRPDWSPAEIQSAMIMTGRERTMRKDETAAADAFDVGGGHVDFADAASSGLVLPVTGEDYSAADPEPYGDPADINLPSLQRQVCVAACSWKRRVKSSLPTSETWSLEFEGPEGFGIEVEPPSFTLAPGELQDLSIRAFVDETLAGWVFGTLRLVPASGSSPALAMPVAVGAERMSLPRLIHLESETEAEMRGVDGFRISAAGGFQPFPVALGLVAATVQHLTLDQAPDRSNPYEEPQGRQVLQVQVPEKSARLVAEIAERDLGNINLFVGLDRNGDGDPQPGEALCSSASNIWAEYCDLHRPEAGRYWIMLVNVNGGDDNAVELRHALVPLGGADALGDSETLAIGDPPAGWDRPDQDFALDLGWRLPLLATGDRWYGALGIAEVGDPDEILGFAPLNLVGVDRRSAPTVTATPRNTATLAPSPVPSETPTPVAPSATPSPEALPAIFLPVLQP